MWPISCRVDRHWRADHGRSGYRRRDRRGQRRAGPIRFGDGCLPGTTLRGRAPGVLLRPELAAETDRTGDDEEHTDQKEEASSHKKCHGSRPEQVGLHTGSEVHRDSLAPVGVHDDDQHSPREHPGADQAKHRAQNKHDDRSGPCARPSAARRRGR